MYLPIPARCLRRRARRQESLHESVAANRRAFDLATDRYTGGLESFLSVRDLQRALYAAEDALARGERNVVVDLIAVYKSLGGGWALDEFRQVPQQVER